MQHPPHLRLLAPLIISAVLSLTMSSTVLAQECLTHFTSINSWQSLDHSNVVARDPATRDLYQLTLARPLSSLSHSTSITLKDVDHDKRICGASNDLLVVNSVVNDGQDLQAVVIAVKKLTTKDIPKLEKQFGTAIRIQGRKQTPKTPTRESAQ